MKFMKMYVSENSLAKHRILGKVLQKASGHLYIN